MMMNAQWQQKDLAQALNLSEKMITVNLSPSRCIPAVQEALKQGKFGISDTYAISKLGEAEQAGLLALKLSGVSRDQLEQAGRKSRNGQSDSVRLEKVIVPVPGGRKVVISGQGLAMVDVVDLLSEVLKEAKRAVELYDVKTWQKLWRQQELLKLEKERLEAQKQLAEEQAKQENTRRNVGIIVAIGRGLSWW
jgi:hypothetical protein